MQSICPNCGCNPQNEPYCMVATHCPMCGYLFKNNTDTYATVYLRDDEMIPYEKWAEFLLEDLKAEDELKNISIGNLIYIMSLYHDRREAASFNGHKYFYTTKEL